MREEEIGLTIVDEPQLGSGSVPTVLEVTDPELVLVRFHGRNYKTWYKSGKSSAERFDYLYSQEELQEWVPKIQNLAEDTEQVYVFMNNCFQAQAAKNATDMLALLQDD